MAKSLACALTHVRQESFFLKKWIDYYGGIVGKENLYIVLDGDDWTPDFSLDGLNVEIILGAPRARIRNDRWVAKEMSRRANALRKRYSFVIRGDVDEYVVIDPESGLNWEQAFAEIGEDGYLFALGVDMVQSAGEVGALDRSAPILGQRTYGYVADRYTKPFVISRFNNWTGGAHRLINRPVKISNHFTLFHMALADQSIAQERMAARGGGAQHQSNVQHQTLRIDAISDTVKAAPTLFDFPTAAMIGRRDFAIEPDGTVASRPRASSAEGATELGLFTRIPDRFHGLI